jgi:hypothetical protein
MLVMELMRQVRNSRDVGREAIIADEVHQIRAVDLEMPFEKGCICEGVCELSSTKYS